MKGIIKLLLVVIALVILVPLVWVLVKEIYWLILPMVSGLFAGVVIGNAFWVMVFILAIVVIIWALAS